MKRIGIDDRCFGEKMDLHILSGNKFKVCSRTYDYIWCIFLLFSSISLSLRSLMQQTRFLEHFLKVQQMVYAEAHFLLPFRFLSVKSTDRYMALLLLWLIVIAIVYPGLFLFSFALFRIAWWPSAIGKSCPIDSPLLLFHTWYLYVAEVKSS